MDPAAAVRSEERAGDIVPAHEQVGKDQPVLDMQSNANVKKLVEALSEMLLELVQVIWIQVYRIIHAPAALAAALAGAAGDPREVTGGQQFCHKFRFLSNILMDCDPPLR
jgi:hypothetical protein